MSRSQEQLCACHTERLMQRGHDYVVGGWRPLTANPSWAGEIGSKAEPGESPAEEEGKQGRRERTSGFYSVTVNRGVIGVWESCSG